MEKYVDVLKRYKLFTGLTPYQIKKLVDFAEIKTFEPNEIIVRENDAPVNIYIILGGEVEILKKEYRIATLTEDNGVIGEISLLDDAVRTATVRSLKSTPMLIIPIEKIRGLVNCDSLDNKLVYYKLAENIARELSGRIRYLNQEMVKMLHDKALDSAKANILANMWRF